MRDCDEVQRLLKSLVPLVAARRRIPTDELLQQVWMRLLLRNVAVDVLAPERRGYLMRVIHNAATDMVRAEKKVRDHELAEPEAVEGASAPRPTEPLRAFAIQGCVDAASESLREALLNGDPLASDHDRETAAAFFLVTFRREVFAADGGRFDARVRAALEAVAAGLSLQAVRKRAWGRTTTPREALEVALAARCAVDSVLFWGSIRGLSALRRCYEERVYEAREVDSVRDDPILRGVRDGLRSLRLDANMSRDEYYFYQRFVLDNADERYRRWAEARAVEEIQRLRASVRRRLPAPDLLARLFE